MKKTILLFMVLLSTVMVSAQVLLDETFNYAGSSLTTESTWTTSSNTGVVGTIGGLTATPLTYGNSSKLFVLSGLGKLVTSNYTSGGSDYKTVKSITPVSSGIIYMSLLFKPGVAQAQSYSEIMALSIAGGNGPKVLIGKGVISTSNFRFGTTRASSGSTDYRFAATEYSDINQTFLLVVKYDWTTKTASLFVNPAIASGSEPTPDVIDNNSAKDVAAAIDGIRFRVNGSSVAKFTVSGVRVSQSWSDAVAQYVSALPALSTPIVGSGDTPTSSGFTAHWTPVANASSYLVQTYLGSNLINTTASAAGASTSSVVVTGLMSGLTYTYKVTAVGDNSSYTNSDASSSSIGITTSDPDAKSSFSTDFSDGTWGTIAPSVPSTGAFTSGLINGFYLNNATLNANTTKGPKGESHTNRISLDKSSTASSVSLPTIISAGQLEIHFGMGTALNTINVREFNITTNTWDLVGTYAYTQASKDAGIDQIVIVPFATPHLNAKFKIENNTSGSCYLTQIIARSTNPTLLTAPTVGTASSIAATTCTANWTPVDANGTNYEVKVYKVIISSTTPGLKTETTTVKATAITSSGQTTTNIGVTGLQADSTYIYKVKAIGDGDMNYSDSYQTISSAQFTMGHQLATPVVGTGTVSATGITANWTNAVVTNVLSYDVNVYQGTTLVKTVNVADPNATSVEINGLAYATEYTFTVTAVGDNSTYFNSAESAKSSPVTTDIGTGVNNTEYKLMVYASGKEIICSEIGNLRVYNVQGVKVLEAVGVSNLSANLSSGLYMISFTAQNGKAVNTKLTIK
ncbi:MAG: fibronectin type III domain-containing protein [Paludibacter sp.]